MLAARAWFFTTARPEPVLTLIESTGTVAWTHGEPILAGAKLAAGTVETVGERAVFQRLFGLGPGGPSKSVLDVILADARSLEKRLVGGWKRDHFHYEGKRPLAISSSRWRKLPE